MNPPPVTVLMAVHNGARYLEASVRSILGQSRGDFEFLIVEDGSTDETPQMLADLASADPRIRILANGANLGLTRSLNIGLAAARGALIARQDADDLAHPDRLARQTAFLEAHPEVGLLGGELRYIDAEGRLIPDKLGDPPPPVSDLEIRWAALLDNPFYHTTVIFRRRLLNETGLRYDETLDCAQDFDLWSRLLDHTQGANLDPASPVADYRMHDQSVSAKSGGQQRANALMTARRRLLALMPEARFEADQLEALRRLRHFTPAAFGPEQRGLIQLMLTILAAFRRRHPDREHSAEMDRIRAQLADRLLAAIPLDRLPSALDLTAAIIRTAPSAAPRHILQRLTRRLGRRAAS